jgi:fluoroquinolone transport system permease protein
MLFAVCLAPILSACFFRFGIPYIEKLLTAAFNKPAVLSEYYLLLDMLLSVITPFMFCFASAMVILTEYDENMVRHLAVTPVGLRGYFISRIIIPAIISFFISVILLMVFSLTRWNIGLLIIVCLLSTLLGVSGALLVISFSANRVEGMALAKLSGLLMLGLPIPFFINTYVQYFFVPLPSYWIAKLCIERNILYLLPATILSLAMLAIFYRKYIKKVI